MHPLIRSTMSCDLVALTTRLLAAPGTLTCCSLPWAGWRPMTRLPQAPKPSRYSPLDSCQALKSPRSKPPVRAGVSAVGRAPLAGTSHICGPAALAAPQVARIVVRLHQRTAAQPSGTLGTGSFRMTPPALLISSRPVAVPAAISVPLELYGAGGIPLMPANRPSPLIVARFFCSLPVRLYRCNVMLPLPAVDAVFSARMLTPSGLV